VYQEFSEMLDLFDNLPRREPSRSRRSTVRVACGKPELLDLSPEGTCHLDDYVQEKRQMAFDRGAVHD
jgi:hypothetical protein